MRIVPETVAIVVKDRRKSAAWYVEKLGFEETAKDDGHWTVVAPKGGAIQFHLCEYDGGRGPNPDETDTGIRLRSDQPLEEAARALKAKGVRFSMEPKKTPWGFNSKIQDPDGNEFWLV